MENTPFVEPSDQTASTVLSSEEETAAVSSMLLGTAETKSWPREMQSEWVIEVEGKRESSNSQRLYAVSRTGELRVATSIATEV